MLALSRKVGERLVIGGNIVVTVVEVKGETVRLAIDAPREIPVYRGEVYDAIEKENRQAAMTKVDLPFLQGLGKKE